MTSNLKSDRPPLVAIVDDDDSLRISTRLLVASFGFDSEAFACAQDLLQWPRLHRVSCLILDVRMPGSNGLELQQQLRRTHPSIPVIFLSARAKEHEERQAMAAGAVAVLRKPVADRILLRSIRAALDSGASPDVGATVEFQPRTLSTHELDQ